ncbi:hypothetical protein [Massilia pseudoviolaceinigra]|nr:hypothetical protein [Massilia sp. CCM 9206]MDQ1919139.1 hypothetical protein [Massilia sp. CCM 9206]
MSVMKASHYVETAARLSTGKVSNGLPERGGASLSLFQEKPDPWKI